MCEGGLAGSTPGGPPGGGGDVEDVSLTSPAIFGYVVGIRKHWR